jgi:hypothetical protein
MPIPVSMQGETRVIDNPSIEVLQQILQELRAIKYVLCKMEGTIDPSDVDAGYFDNVGAPSGASGS